MLPPINKICPHLDLDENVPGRPSIYHFELMEVGDVLHQPFYPGSKEARSFFSAAYHYAQRHHVRFKYQKEKGENPWEDHVSVWRTL